MSHVSPLGSTKLGGSLRLAGSWPREIRAEGSVAVPQIREYQTIRALPHNPGVGNSRGPGSHPQRSG